jgi:hypothetical protein
VVFVKWYHRLSRRGQLAVTLAIGIPVAVIVCVLVYMWLVGISFSDFRSPTAASPCPAYDPECRLEVQDDLTEQDVAQYVAALLPTEYQDSLLGVKITGLDGTSLGIEVYWDTTVRFGGVLLGESDAPPQDVINDLTQSIYSNTDYTISSLAYNAGIYGTTGSVSN